MTQGVFQPEVTHQGTDYRSGQLFIFLAGSGDDEKQLVAIDQLTSMINHNDAVAITIQRNTQIGTFFQHPLA